METVIRKWGNSPAVRLLWAPVRRCLYLAGVKMLTIW